MKLAHKIILGAVAGVAIALLVFRKPVEGNSRSDAKSLASQNRAIDALLGPLSGTNSYANTNKMKEHLGRPDGKALRIMMAEINMIPILEKEGKDASERKYRIRKGFAILGTNAEPLIPELAEVFLSGRNPGDSSWALLDSGSKAWPFLLQGLTNEIPQVRNCAAYAVGLTDKSTAGVAFPYVLAFLTNESPSLRLIAAMSLGNLAFDCELATPPLLKTAEQDADASVRLQATQALGRRAAKDTNAIAALQMLNQISSDEDVKKEATWRLRKALQRKNDE